MCLIIEREPNFEIPYEKFKSAVINNPHGYGLSFPDDKGLTVFKTPDEPDPEKLYRLVNEELKDKKLLLHLRYTTVGETSMRNAHPFPILEKKSDGIDLRMAHNGTLSKYRPSGTSTESDTRVFVKTFVRPLFKRMVKAMGPEEVLQDTFLKTLLEDQLTSASVLTFLDNNGNSLVCNETGNGGKREDGWYYSNTYSFNPKHREPTPPKKYYPPVTYSTGSVQKDSDTKRFTERYDMKSIYDSLEFSDELIAKISKKPYEACLLIKELLETLYKTKGNHNVN